MSKLALLGGEPLSEKKMDWSDFWPPIKESTGDKLKELYLSRKWTAFDSLEGEFAQAFAKYHGAKYGIFMVNGTVTLQCALGACGIGPGDEVIVPALTWYATAMAAHYVGATPVFVDIDSETLCIDPEKIVQAITEKTKAIIPVHLYGSMADMDNIMAIAKQHGLRVIEDCAHMHGGVWDGKGIGSIGDVGSFSFQHSKTMASGEGGICITDDPELADRIFRMKHIGYGPGQLQGKALDGPEEGLLCYPFRATAFQALILNDQLKDLGSHLQRYQASIQFLEDRLHQTTKIRFQKAGRKADNQGYFGWLMIFDDPSYADIPIGTIQEAISAEGLPVLPTWGPVYDFILFNLSKESYRIDQAGSPVTESISKHSLFLLHAYLGLGQDSIEKIADIIEKIMNNCDALREYARLSAT
mgnify:CR=1 FL=1